MYNTILDIWPTTLTYNPNLAKVNLHTKYQGLRSIGAGVRALTDRQTDATKCIYLPASLSYAVDNQQGHNYRHQLQQVGSLTFIKIFNAFIITLCHIYDCTSIVLIILSL